MIYGGKVHRLVRLIPYGRLQKCCTLIALTCGVRVNDNKMFFFGNLSVSGETFFASGARQAAILVLLFGGKKVLREKNCTTGQSGDKNCINKG